MLPIWPPWPETAHTPPKDDMARHIDDSDMDEDKYKKVLKTIHTEEVTATI